LGRGEQIRQALAWPIKPRVTPVLIGLNILVFAAGLVIAGGQVPFLVWANGQVPMRTGAVNQVALLRGEWWRLLTSCFVHFGVLHIGLNMYGLWIVGRLAEQMWGRWRYLAIYLIAGFGGSCAAMYLSQPRTVL